MKLKIGDTVYSNGIDLSTIIPDIIYACCGSFCAWDNEDVYRYKHDNDEGYVWLKKTALDSELITALVRQNEVSK